MVPPFTKNTKNRYDNRQLCVPLLREFFFEKTEKLVLEKCGDERDRQRRGGYRNITMTVQHGGIRSHEDCLL